MSKTYTLGSSTEQVDLSVKGDLVITGDFEAPYSNPSNLPTATDIVGAIDILANMKPENNLIPVTTTQYNAIANADTSDDVYLITNLSNSSSTTSTAATIPYSNSNYPSTIDTVEKALNYEETTTVIRPGGGGIEFVKRGNWYSFRFYGALSSAFSSGSLSFSGFSVPQPVSVPVTYLADTGSGYDRNTVVYGFVSIEGNTITATYANAGSIAVFGNLRSGYKIYGTATVYIPAS